MINISLKASNGKIVSADQNLANTTLAANRDAVGSWETFGVGMDAESLQALATALQPYLTAAPPAPPLPPVPPIPPSSTDAFPIEGLVVEGGSPNVKRWDITTILTQLAITPEGVRVEFTKKTGLNRWPDVTTPGWDGPLQYTLWICMNLGGIWHGAGVIEYWYGRESSQDNVLEDNQIAKNWTYYCGPMVRQPQPGELVGFFVTAGDQRRKDVHLVTERSNIVAVKWPMVLPASWTW